MRLFTFFFSLFFIETSLAQDANNFLQVNTNATLNFIFDDPSDIESPQIIPNAISIQVRSKDKSCNISARLSAFTYPYSFVPSSSMIALNWTSDNSNKKFNLNPNPVYLNAMDQLLFSQNKHPQIFTYNYNLIFQPAGYDMVPGTYSFTILFTMTQL